MTHSDDDVKAAAQTYLYGYPLVYNLTEIAKFPAGRSPAGVPVPYNTLGRARDLLGPKTKFVTPNNDTLYIVAACDVGAGPLVLHVPATGDRYYVLQFVDAWTNNFAYVGERATGTAEGDFLLAPADYAGPVPDGSRLVAAPSSVFAIVGRVQVNGADDLPAVHVLQDQFTLAPMDPGDAPAPAGVPAPTDGVDPELAFWERFRVAMQAFPPPEADEPFVAAAAKLGLTASESPYVDPDPDLAALLTSAETQGRTTIETLGTTLIKPVDGWTTALHAFDYNLDHLGLGTIDDPEWKIADRTIAYATRAVAARLGLWGNHGYEADYHILWQDGDGRPLDGAHAYELTLAPPPPVDAFWSLTMYDSPDYYMVDNPIDRYSIGDRTPGLTIGTDGSLTILLQHESPGPDAESNWLPAPPGRFRPVLRSYLPGAALLAGEYRFPKVCRTS